MIVLDTNVVSELMKPAPDARVIRRLAAWPIGRVCTTAVTEAEILVGVARLPEGKRKESLRTQADGVFAEDFADRVLSFDSAAARLFAAIVGRRLRAGRPIAQLDAQIAAIALAHDAAVATRNVADFAECGVAVIDPWTA